VALTLKVVAGLSTAAVARAFLVPEATMGQRLLRAKNKIANAGIPYRVPTPAMLPERLDGVLAVVYLAFTEGYAATDDATAEEAIRLGRLLVELVLVEGELVSLEQQDRRRWDRAAIDEALDLGRIPGAAPGKYRLQAALAAVHATASRADDTDWPSIVTLYDELLRVVPSPVVALNRAIALGMGDGPQAGLAALDALAGDPRMTGYHLVPAARGHLLAQLGRSAEAVDSLDRAIELAPTERERRQLVRRRDELGDTGD
jgi:RNA polymerase sigma-70 factor (ECF subfamily)